MEQAVVLYDRDCGLCTWSAERLRTWDGPRRRLRFVPLQTVEAEELLGDMASNRRFASWHVVNDGVVSSAGAAFGPVLRLVPGGRQLARIAEALPRTTQVLYRLVADNRERIGAAIGREACAVDPSRPPGA